MARFAVAAVVGVVAFVASGYNSYVGFQAFALTYGVTGFLDPKGKVLGPRLQDLKAPQASYGSPIPLLWGAPRLAGIYVWASDKHEIATSQTQGKGGPGVKSTTFTYEIDALIMLAGNQCAGIRRVWSNGKLVWSNAEDAVAETILASAQTVSWRDIRFYGGADGQMPDTTYEAAVGIGNAPAYRGRSTVFIEGLNLGASGQLPVLTFEVLSLADTSYESSTFATFPLGPRHASQVAGITAIASTGFNVLYGLDYVGGAFTDYGVYVVGANGAVDPTPTVFSLSGPHGPCAYGNSDVSCLLASGSVPVVSYTVAFEDGSYTALPTEMVNVSVTFSKVGDDIVLASSDSLGANDGKFRRYNAVTGAIEARSVAMAQPVQSIAIGGGRVYGLAEDGFAVYELNLSTLALLSTFDTPKDGATAIAHSGSLVCDEAGSLYLFTLGWSLGPDPHPFSVWSWNGAGWALAVDNESDLYASSALTGRRSNSARNGLFATQKYDSTSVSEKFFLATSRIGIVLPSLADVVSDLCLRGRQLEAADIDVTALAGKNVRALAVTQVGPARSTLEMLAGIYLFEWVEGQKLRAVLRGGAPVATIPYEDLGASEEGDAEPLPTKRLNEAEVPALVTVKFANVLNDFQDGAESGDRLVTTSRATSVIEVPIGLTPAEAKKVADVSTMDLAVSRLQIGPVMLTKKYAALEPTDPVLLTDVDGSIFRARIVNLTLSGGVHSADLVLDDATIVNSAVATDSSYSASTLIRLLADTDFELLDIPPLRDPDNAPGLYVAGKPAGGGRSSGFELDKSADDVSYAKVLDSNARAVMGTASTTLGTFTGGNVFDEVHTLTVDVGAGTLASSTRDTLLDSTANALLVGGEIVQFRSASLLSPGVYLLSGFLRGRRGTEWAISGHLAAERVVLLSTETLRRVVDQQADIGVPYYWKAVTFNKSRTSAQAKLVTDTGVSLKPFAPVDLELDRTAGAAVLSWHRRSRLSSRLFSTSGDPPLGEASQQYDVELRDASNVLVQSATVAVPSYSISSLVAGDYILPPIWGMKTISGDRVAVRDDLPYSTSYPRSLVKLAADGTIAQQSSDLGEEVYQWCNNGDSIYAAVASLVGSPAAYVNSRVVKLTRGTLTTIDATNTATTGGDYWGVAHDGTNVWVSERLTGNLRKLNATTLVSVAAYAIAGGPTVLQHASGKLWVACNVSNELVKWDIATQTEDLRLALSGRPSDLLVVGTRVFVACASTTEVRDTATGSLIASHAYGANNGLPMRALAEFGSQVLLAGYASGTGTRLLLLNALTGVQQDLFSQPTVNFYFPAGSSGTDLYLTGSEGSGYSLRTRKYTVAPPGLVGYTATVWQRSPVVGRGYPATLEL